VAGESEELSEGSEATGTDRPASPFGEFTAFPLGELAAVNIEEFADFPFGEAAVSREALAAADFN
jgi:hypothetical protein